MRQILPVIFLMFIALLPAGCETYPLGMSKEEWTLLSPEQKAEAQRQQAAIDAENRRRAAEEEARRREIEAQEQARRQAEIEHRYRHARFGDIVSVTIEGGQMNIDGKHRDYEPVAFDLVRGESRVITIHRRDRHHDTTDVVVRLSDDGRTFYFDDASSRRLSFIEKHWDRGQVYDIESHKNSNAEPRGVRFTLRYKPLRRW